MPDTHRGYQCFGDMVAIQVFGGEPSAHGLGNQYLRPHVRRAPSRISLPSASRGIIARGAGRGVQSATRST